MREEFMYLLIDECCGKALVRFAESLGHTAQRTVEVATLGRQATDREIFDFAQRFEAVLVTVNAGDFIELAAAGRDHVGVILIPSLAGSALRPMFNAALVEAERLFAATPNLFVELHPDGKITSFTMPKP